MKFYLKPFILACAMGMNSVLCSTENNVSAAGFQETSQIQKSTDTTDINNTLNISPEKNSLPASDILKILKPEDISKQPEVKKRSATAIVNIVSSAISLASSLVQFSVISIMGSMTEKDFKKNSVVICGAMLGSIAIALLSGIVALVSSIKR
jgi:hypothetical protein